ncbi:MAG: DoxX family protein [Planctomycetota bacterium]
MSDSRTGWRPWIALLARLAMGGMFIYLGLMKLQDPSVFLKILREYEIFPASQPWLMNLTASALPWMEVFCGGLLVLGIAVRGTALLMLVLMAGFTVAVYLRAAHLAEAGPMPLCSVEFDCGCGTGLVNTCGKLLENGALLLAGLVVLFGSSRRFCLWR